MAIIDANPEGVRHSSDADTPIDTGPSEVDTNVLVEGAPGAQDVINGSGAGLAPEGPRVPLPQEVQDDIETGGFFTKTRAAIGAGVAAVGVAAAMIGSSIIFVSAIVAAAIFSSDNKGFCPRAVRTLWLADRALARC